MPWWIVVLFLILIVTRLVELLPEKTSWQLNITLAIAVLLIVTALMNEAELLSMRLRRWFYRAISEGFGGDDLTEEEVVRAERKL